MHELRQRGVREREERDAAVRRSSCQQVSRTLDQHASLARAGACRNEGRARMSDDHLLLCGRRKHERSTHDCQNAVANVRRDVECLRSEDLLSEDLRKVALPRVLEEGLNCNGALSRGFSNRLRPLDL